MPTVMYPAYPVFDPATGEPLLTIRGEAGRVVQRGTETDVTLVDSNGLPMAQPLYVTDRGFLPTFGVVEGLTQVDFISGDIRMPIWSPTGLEASAAESAADAEAARAAAEAASVLVDAPADTVVSTMISDTRTLTGAAVLDQFSNFLAGAVRDSAPMTKWAAALAGAGSAPAQAIVIGDSISEGSGATNVALRWQTLLQQTLAPNGAKFPFIPAYPATGTAWPVVRAGTVAVNSAWGLGFRTAILQDAAATLTFTFNGTSCKVMYTKASATGVMSIAIDGGTPVVVNTNSSVGGTSQASTWSSPALTSGDHTVVIKRDATSATGQHPYIQGLLTYKGDETTGVRILDAAHSGWASQHYTTGAAGRITYTSLALQAAGGAKLAIIAFGTNDPLYNITGAQFRTNMENIIAGLRSGGFSGTVVLLHVYKGNSLDEATYAAYGTASAALADSDPDVVYLNLRDYMPDVPTPYTAPEGRGFYADGLHPSDLGYARMNEIIGSRVTGSDVLTMLSLRAT